MSYGTVYSLDPGTGAQAVVHTFGSRDDRRPDTGLTDLNNVLYGTTKSGGTHRRSVGTIFPIDPATGAEAVIYSFPRREIFANGLTQAKGKLYGTTFFGGFGCGTAGCGSVYRIKP